MSYDPHGSTPGSSRYTHKEGLMVITRVGPVSCAKVAGMLYAVLGLIFGGMFSLVALGGGFAAGDSDMGFVGGALGVGAVVLMPILYGCFGFVMTLIMAALYNVVAGVAGGVELDLQ
jgi:hypothetical protein